MTVWNVARKDCEMENEKIKDMPKTTTSLIEAVCDEVCMNLCKYTDTTDEWGNCDYIREHERCPLDWLTR